MLPLQSPVESTRRPLCLCFRAPPPGSGQMEHHAGQVQAWRDRIRRQLATVHPEATVADLEQASGRGHPRTLCGLRDQGLRSEGDVLSVNAPCSERNEEGGSVPVHRRVVVSGWIGRIRAAPAGAPSRTDRTPGVVPALHLAALALTAPGDGVLTVTPI